MASYTSVPPQPRLIRIELFNHNANPTSSCRRLYQLYRPCDEWPHPCSEYLCPYMALACVYAGCWPQPHQPVACQCPTHSPWLPWWLDQHHQRSMKCPAAAELRPDGSNQPGSPDYRPSWQRGNRRHVFPVVLYTHSSLQQPCC